MDEFEIAYLALERMCVSADKQFKISEYFTKRSETQPEDAWILSAQSTKQKELLKKHKKELAIFVEGPHVAWVRGRMVNYFVMKTDPLPEIKEKIEQIATHEEDNFANVHNMFNDPFRKESEKNKKPRLSVHEQPEGIVYAICCTENSSKQSVLSWTKFLEESNECLKNYAVLFRIKDAPGYLAEYRPPAKEKTNV